MTFSNSPFATEPSHDETADREQATKMVRILRKASEIEDMMVELESALHDAGYGPWSEQIWAGNKKVQEIGSAINTELNTSYDHVRSDAEDADKEAVAA